MWKMIKVFHHSMSVLCLFNPYQKGGKWSQYALKAPKDISRCFKLWYKHGIVDTFITYMAIISQFWLKKSNWKILLKGRYKDILGT